MNQTLDPNILALTKGIAMQENNGKTPDYNAVGDNGTAAGAYQWSNEDENGNPVKLASGAIPSNFQADAKKFGRDPNDFSEENQNKVAYDTIKNDIDNGLTPAQAASKWNSGDPNAYKNSQGGYNPKIGSPYNTAQYVQNVQKYAEQFFNQNKGNQTPATTTPQTAPATQNQTSTPSWLNSLVDNIVSAPASLIVGAESAGLNALGIKNNPNVMLPGGTAPVSPVTGVADVAGKALTTAGEVASVALPEASLPWLVPGLFGGGVVAEDIAQGKTAGQATVEGLETTGLTYLAGKVIGGVANAIGTEAIKFFSTGIGAKVTTSLAGLGDSLKNIMDNPEITSSPRFSNVIAEAEQKFNGLNKQLADGLFGKNTAQGGFQVPNATENAYKTMFTEAKANLTSLFTGKDSAYADIARRTDIDITADPKTFSNTAKVFDNAEAQFSQTATPEGLTSRGVAPIKWIPPYSIAKNGVDTVYHQTTPENAKTLTFGYSDKSGMFVSPSEDLALGQKGKGALIEIDSSRIESRGGSRPDLNGNPSEFEILKAPDKMTQDVKSVIFDKEPKGGFGNWTREVLPDGKIKYSNPDFYNKVKKADPLTVEAQFSQTATPEGLTSGGVAPIKGIPQEPTGLWNEYLDAVSPILNQDGSFKEGVNLGDFEKAKLASGASNLSKPVQTMVDKTFASYETEALGSIKAQGTNPEIFDKNGNLTSTGAFQDLKEKVGHQVASIFNKAKNPSQLFSNLVDGLSGSGLTEEQISTIPKLFGDNVGTMQDGLFNEILDRLNTNIQSGNGDANEKLLNNVLTNAQGAGIFSAQQMNQLEFGIKPLATADFQKFMGNVGIGQAEATPEAVAQAGEAGQAQENAQVLQKNLSTNDPDLLYKNISKMTPTQQDMISQKLSGQAQEDFQKFMFAKALQNTDIAIKDPVTGKVNISGIQQFSDNLEKVKSAFSPAARTQIDDLSNLLKGKENLDNASATTIGSIFKGIRKIVLGEVSGTGFGRFSGTVDIAKGVSLKTVSPSQYASLVKQLVDSNEKVTGEDVMKLLGIPASGSLRSGAMNLASWGASAVQAIKGIATGLASQNVVNNLNPSASSQK